MIPLRSQGIFITLPGSLAYSGKGNQSWSKALKPGVS